MSQTIVASILANGLWLLFGQDPSALTNPRHEIFYATSAVVLFCSAYRDQLRRTRQYYLAADSGIPARGILP